MIYIYVRPLTTEETQAVQALTRSADRVTFRRAQTIQLSAQGQTAPHIARALGCTARNIRGIIQAFNQRGLASLPRRKASGRPHRCTPAQAAALVALVHQAPTTFGIERGFWTQEDLRTVAIRQGLVPPVCRNVVRAILRQAGYRWQRAKRRSTSPDPAYEKKTR